MKASTYLIAAAACASLQACAFAEKCDSAEVTVLPESCTDVTFSAAAQVAKGDDCSKLDSIITQTAYDKVQQCKSDIQSKFTSCEVDQEFESSLNSTLSVFDLIFDPDVQCGAFKTGEYCADECVAAFNNIDTTSGASTTQATLAVGVLACVTAYLAADM